MIAASTYRKSNVDNKIVNKIFGRYLTILGYKTFGLKMREVESKRSSFKNHSKLLH